MENSTILKFGRFKGKKMSETPDWYQTWLKAQPWFNKPEISQEQTLHRQLRGWDGHSRKGQAIYDRIFEREQEEQEKYDPSDRYGMYEGIN